jgi:hypothetical protein
VAVVCRKRLTSYHSRHEARGSRPEIGSDASTRPTIARCIAAKAHRVVAAPSWSAAVSQAAVAPAIVLGRESPDFRRSQFDPEPSLTELQSGHRSRGNQPYAPYKRHSRCVNPAVEARPKGGEQHRTQQILSLCGWRSEATVCFCMVARPRVGC